MSAYQALPQLVSLAKEIDEDKVTPGVLGFIVFAALAVGVWLLMKSMNKHMGKVDFEEAPDSSAEASASASGSGSASASASGSASGSGKGGAQQA
ncbi:hypothetical protein [Streptomyces sp. NBC_01304]|uniref:hypothetical protein n=1 Tax=Streptomyces sp. NBC_01304 TaxID=2903818 RepID=UPI003FA343EF